MTAPAAGDFPASAWRHARAKSATGRSDSDRRGRIRVALAMAGFGLLFGMLATRLVLLGVSAADYTPGGQAFVASGVQARPDIVDRNGETLATDIKTASLFAEPRSSSTPTRRRRR